jgi:CheY-like chemotaxis protein
MSAARPRILVVDDVPLFREVEALYLGRLGAVRSAANAREARAKLAEEPADVVVLDLHLPDEGGDVVCRELSQLPAHRETRWLFVTRADAADHARAIAAGASDVLAKPLSRADLVAAVGHLLRPGRGMPRAPLREPAHLWAEDRVSTGTVQNVSRGGLFVSSGWLPREGAEVRIEFRVPDSEQTVAPTGRVMWRRLEATNGPAGFGVRFVAIDGRAQRALTHYVQDHTSQPGARA